MLVHLPPALYLDSGSSKKKKLVEKDAEYVRSKFPPLFSMEAAGRDLISHDSEILILFVAQINCHLFSQQKGFIINP